LYFIFVRDTAKSRAQGGFWNKLRRGDKTAAAQK